MPYLLALLQYFRICGNIGGNRSFCRENVLRMNRIGTLLMVAAGMWLAALAGHFLGIMETVFPWSIALCIDGLALMASLAVALVAKMMGYLLNRAAGLQEDSDLTI